MPIYQGCRLEMSVFLQEQKTRSLERMGMAIPEIEEGRRQDFKMAHEVKGEEGEQSREGLPLQSDDSVKRHERGGWITALGEGRDAMLLVHSKIRDGF